MKPNPILAPVKEYIRRYGGWGRRFTPEPPTVPDSIGNRVFVIEPKIIAPERRFAVVAPSWEAAYDRLNLLLS